METNPTQAPDGERNEPHKLTSVVVESGNISITDMEVQQMKKSLSHLAENIIDFSSDDVNEEYKQDSLVAMHDMVINYIKNQKVTNAKTYKRIEEHITYASRTLHRTASSQRRREVKTRFTSGLNIQVQGTSNYCGLCSINNVIVVYVKP